VRELVVLEAGGGECPLVQRMRVAGHEHGGPDQLHACEKLFVVACVEVVLVGVVAVLAARVRVIRRVEVEHGAGSVVALDAFAPVELLDLHAAKPLGELLQAIDGGGIRR
jgi:hypothetical protein